jgi:outer membrane protein OmpA-like peptidoglycan-associated protein/tetratricopeptide (TPR) repeat protein
LPFFYSIFFVTFYANVNRMRYCITCILLLLSIQVFTQQPYKTISKKAIKYYEDGLASYNQRYYPIAEQYLKDAIKTDHNFQNAYLVLAEVYWDMGKYDLAIDYYDRGLKIDSTFYPKGYLNKGKLEIKIGRYKNALSSFKTYLALDPIDTKYILQAKQGIKQALFATHAMANPVDFNPVNLGPNVNSKADEYWPSVSADGQTLFITRLVHSYDVTTGNRIQEDFFFSHYADGNWMPMKNAGFPLNTPDNEGAQSISANGKLMVYTVCNRMGVIGRCDIYYSEKKGDEWAFPKNLGAPVNTASKETQPSLSADGRTIYFASDRPGGKGGLDIWVSQRNEDGSWQVPLNLGDSINTPGDEMSPFIHQDNNTLYFSSNAHIGMGGFDLYIARRDEKGNFTHVKNLGYPINTPGDEIGLIVSAKGDMAYYASDMQKEKGKDIYQFVLYQEARPSEVSYMKGQVFDETTRERLKAKFELYNLGNGNLVSQSESDERTGEFLVCIPTNTDYMLNVACKGYLFYSDNFSLKGLFHLEEPFLKDIPLKPIETGGTIILKNIFYETDSYALKPESRYELDKVVKFMESNPQIKIEISGHTDNVGTESYNQSLSENRAKSVVEYLTSKGINALYLTYKGYGFSKPLDSNETPEGRANNRRTELKIME